eukprot:1644616-Amphidinium_carterae.5
MSPCTNFSAQRLMGMAVCGSVGHPFDLDATLPSAMLHSLGAYLESHPARVVQSRSDYLKGLLCKKRELESQEKALHDSLPSSLQKALKGKSLLLLQWALKEAQFPDEHLVSDIIQGFRTMGKARRSPVYPAALLPSSATEETFWKNAKWKRACHVPLVRSSGNRDSDLELWRKTLDGRDEGYLDGPYTRDQIEHAHIFSERWCPIRRFPVVQSSKLRPIDDGRENGVNDSFCVTNKLTLHDVDVLGVL